MESERKYKAVTKAPLIPITFYQKERLRLALDTCDIPWLMVSDQLSAMLYRPDELLCEETLVYYLSLLGSASYNVLALDNTVTWRKRFDNLEKALYEKVEVSLRGHGIKEMYRYAWVWSLDNSVLARGDSWHTDLQRCKEQGSKCRPSVETWDGPDAPFTQLVIESTCPCYVTLEPWEFMKKKDMIRETPCRCVSSNLQQQQLQTASQSKAQRKNPFL